MPKDVVAKLNAEIARIVALPDMQARFAKELNLTVSTPEQFGSFIEADVNRWAKILKE